ncbi:M1 family metallopeptidase [Shewanella sp. C32]|uniref:M1 family metallopeptidase n=1 Tax=Shewanella electrica TaxID=515560 RepID=A0ABT2FJN8_9GAMM|nr:M1 family metallopeptidase [Shewanella electrica]MCH1924299.1 M1 family metallopeptidase [Shewanella electrica]MCS4556202.1 M1 family metallopeptidase [Shewanella electrica]
MSFNWPKTVASVVAVSSTILMSASTIAAPSPYDARELFAPLSLPTSVSAYRNGAGKPGELYWQNKVDYNLQARIDIDTQQLHGEEVITYTNNSPDQLEQLWLQLDQNMYQKDSRASIASEWHRSQFTDGYQIASVEVLYRGKTYPAEILIDDTRMRVSLPQPLAAKGGKLQLKISYSYQIPGTWGGRTAVTPTQNSKIFEMAQFYPRMAVYDDQHGWHNNPYVGSEFYLEYGTIDYTVTVPDNYYVVGSGELINPKAVLSKTEQQRLAKAKESDKTVYIRTAADAQAAVAKGSNGTRDWHFRMEHTRDVAFAASPDFIIDAARINLPDGKHSLAMSAYPPEAAGSNKWDRSTEYVKGSIEHFSQWYPYPWPAAVNLGGHGAGMEYPGIVFDGMNDKDDKLFWITAHELGHTWFPMIVGSDERRHAFMDEGFNTFIDVYASDAFNNGEFAPKRDGEYAPKGGNPVDEILPLLADAEAPSLMQPAEAVAEKYRHSVSYFKGALGLILLREQILGPDRFDPAFKAYIKTWAYKHPTPSDFFRFMESAAGEDLTWWWRGWYLNNWQLDMAVTGINAVDTKRIKGTEIHFASQQKLVMPATLRLQFKDGTSEDMRLPIEVWMNHNAPSIVLPLTKPLQSVTLDPEHKLPDANRANNTFTVK